MKLCHFIDLVCPLVRFVNVVLSMLNLLVPSLDFSINDMKDSKILSTFIVKLSLDCGHHLLAIFTDFTFKFFHSINFKIFFLRHFNIVIEVAKHARMLIIRTYLLSLSIMSIWSSNPKSICSSASSLITCNCFLTLRGRFLHSLTIFSTKLSSLPLSSSVE